MTHRLVRRGVYSRRVTGHVERPPSLSAGANAHRLPRPAEPPRLLGQEEQINSRRASPCQAQTRVLTTRCHVVQQSIHSIMRRVMTPDPASLVPHRNQAQAAHCTIPGTKAPSRRLSVVAFGAVGQQTRPNGLAEAERWLSVAAGNGRARVRHIRLPDTVHVRLASTHYGHGV